MVVSSSPLSSCSNVAPDLNWKRHVGGEDLTPLDAADRGGVPELIAWLRTRGAELARELG